MYGLPLWIFLLLFFFYGYGQATSDMFIKITGLWALVLLGITFLIGPLSYFWSHFNQLKVYRKYLGISGFLVALLHGLIAYIFHFDANLFFILFNSQNEDLLGVYIGFIALGIFLLMAVTSTEKAVELLGFRCWKALQTTGYLAFLLAMLHFILMETEKGIFIIKRPLGRVIFVFGLIVLIIRLFVFFLLLVKGKSKKRDID